MYTVPSGAIAAAPFSGQPRVLPLTCATVNVWPASCEEATKNRWATSNPTYTSLPWTASPSLSVGPWRMPTLATSTYTWPRPSDSTAGSQSSPDGKPITRGVAKLPPPAAWAVSDNAARDTITPTDANKRNWFRIENPLRGKGNLAITVRGRSTPRERPLGTRLCPVEHTGLGASMVSLQTLAKSIVRESLRPKEDEVV